MKLALLNEYVDICVAMQFFESDAAYAREVGYYNGLEISMYEKRIELQRQIIMSHPSFKKRRPISVWSAGDLELVMPFAEGKVVLSYDGGWGEPSVSHIVKNPTYLDMFVLADNAIRLSGDRHHVFVEAFNKRRRSKNGDVKHYSLGTGS